MAAILRPLTAMSATSPPAAPAASHSIQRLEPRRHDELHPELDAWRANVGGPVMLDAAAVAAPRLTAVDVLCWNVAIGLGRLEKVLGRLWAGAFGGAERSPERPLVVLVQEAYRHDPSVPDEPGSLHHGGWLAARERVDIAEVAASCGLSLRYAPSMRNGTHASDRGNAILSTVKLHDAHAFILPYVRQRRVVVSAQLAGHPELTFVTAHLDTHGRVQAAPSPLRFAAGRVAQAHALGKVLGGLRGSVVLGADLNTLLGTNDPALRALLSAGMLPTERAGTWRHTFHTRVKLLLDHVLYRSSNDVIEKIEVARLDEAAEDRSAGVFGSDHHPLLARITLRAQSAT